MDSWNEEWAGQTFPDSALRILRIDDSVSSDAVRHRAVHASGERVAGPLTAQYGIDSWHHSRDYDFIDLPDTISPGATGGIGVIVEVSLSGEPNPGDPVVEITGVIYTDHTGEQFHAPVHRVHRISRLAIGADLFCAALPGS